MKKLILVSVILPLFFACERDSNAFGYEGGSSDEEILAIKRTDQSGFKSDYKSNGNDKVESESITDDRKMIWTANMEFQVEQVEEATRAIESLVKESGGFVSKMNMTTDDRRISNSISIRVNGDKFESLVNSIKSKAVRIDHVQKASNDVTAEFIDIESRLKTKKEARDRYIEILNTKTGKVKDIIQAEEAIRVITEEIEAKEGRLRYLRDKVKYSTIRLTIYEKVEYQEKPEIFEKPYVKKFTESLAGGWSIVTGFLLFCARIWPLLILLFLILWQRKRIFGWLK